MMDALRAVIDGELGSHGRHRQRGTCVAQQQEVLHTLGLRPTGNQRSLPPARGHWVLAPRLYIGLDVLNIERPTANIE